MPVGLMPGPYFDAGRPDAGLPFHAPASPMPGRPPVLRVAQGHIDFILYARSDRTRLSTPWERKDTPVLSGRLG